MEFDSTLQGKKMGFYNETGTLVSKLDLQDFKAGTY